LHAPLWYEAGARRSKSSGRAPVWNCNRESITNPSQYDWTESLWSDRLRFAVSVDYAVDRNKRAVAQSYRRKEPADEEQNTIRWAGCTC
jgi:hypothetical protein